MGDRPARPVVGVPALLTRLPPASSVARIWDHGLAGLAADVDLRVVERPGRRFRDRRVDVWLTDGHQGPLDVSAPVVAHLHEAAWADPTLRPLMEPAFLERYEGPSAAAVARAARVLTVSESSKAQIVAAYGIDPDRVDVGWNGVDHAVYRPGLPPPGDLLRAAGGDPDRPYVLFVSTVHPRKNLDALRAAMGALAADGLPHTLVLVAGPAADRGDSDELLAAAVAPIEGTDVVPVNLAGAPDADVARLMAGAAALCQPSLMEGFGMAVAEAMACGAACVVSDRGSLPEVVGDAGIVVAPDAESIAAGLRTVLTDPDRRAALGTAAVERAARYTWEHMVEVWLGSIRRALDAR